ncbi:hypothetical protein H0H81_000290 [Sphagnurus paluster]|uniref:Uncharacterized protein n=1 Tax=Sphagnurus paluster TaxID=117069 RepID=A0A9P7FU50_9AGAR|nr:hypothetical protein H0H81_000290 [Sphagnurus paluster]
MTSIIPKALRIQGHSISRTSSLEKKISRHHGHGPPHASIPTTHRGLLIEVTTNIPLPMPPCNPDYLVTTILGKAIEDATRTLNEEFAEERVVDLVAFIDRMGELMTDLSGNAKLRPIIDNNEADVALWNDS